MRKGTDTYTMKYEIVCTSVHPKYNGDPLCGWDVGLCFLGKEYGNKNADEDNYSQRGGFSNDFRYSVSPKELKAGHKVSIAGYAGDEDKKGYLYEHTDEIVSVKKTKLGGYIVSYKVDATPGTSGAKIELIDDKLVAKVKSKTVLKFDKDMKIMTIGIHSGNDSVNNVNFGTLITPKLD